MTQYGPEFFRKYADLITEAETVRLDEGIVDSLKQLYQSLVGKVKVIPNFKQYYDVAKTKQQEAVEAIKTSKSPEELKQKIASIADATQVNESTIPSWYRHPKAKRPVVEPVLGAVAATAAGLWDIWAAQVIGIYSQVATYAAAGETGMAVAGGLMFGVVGQLGALGVALYLASQAKQNAAYNTDPNNNVRGNPNFKGNPYWDGISK